MFNPYLQRQSAEELSFVLFASNTTNKCLLIPETLNAVIETRKIKLMPQFEDSYFNQFGPDHLSQ